MEQDFCLKWNNHQQNVITILETLLQRESLVDVTLMADGRMLPAHKFVLSASSPYFENICSQFSDKHTVIVLKDVSYNDMKALLEFMYKGEVKVPADQLGSLVKTAMSLKIKGLGDDNDEEPSTKGPPSPLPPTSHRKTSFENSLDSRKERSRPESPVSTKPVKKMRLDMDDSVREVVPHSPENRTSPSENIVPEQSVENAVGSPNETSTERTSRRSTDTPKLEVKAELHDVASSPEIIEEPMDDYDDSRTETQGGIMQTLPGTSGTSEEEVYSPWPFTQETSADDSVSLPEGSQDKSASSSPKHQQESQQQKEKPEEDKEKEQESEETPKESQSESENEQKEKESEENQTNENHQEQEEENDTWEGEPEPEGETHEEEEIDVEKQHEEDRQQEEQRKLLETVKQQLEQEEINKQKMLEQEKLKQEQIIKQQLEQGKLKQERMLKQQAEREKIRQEQLIKQQLEQQKLRMEQQKQKQDLIIKQQQALIKTQQQQLQLKQQQLDKQQQFQRQQQFQKQQQLQKQQQFQRQQQLQKQQQLQRQQQMQMQNRQQFQQRQQIPQVQQQQQRPRMTAAQVVAATSSMRPRVKRPMNAYMLWAQNERMKVSQQCPDLSVADVSKILGVRWNAMSHDEKRPFYEEHNRLQKLHMETNPGFQFLRPQQQQQRARGARPILSPQQQRMMIQNRPRMDQARAMMRQRINPRFNPVISNIRAVGPRMVKPEIKLIEEISLDDDDEEEEKLAALNIKRESVEGGMEVEVEEFQGVDLEKKVSTEEMKRILMKREIIEEEDEYEDTRDVKNVLLIRPDVDEVDEPKGDAEDAEPKDREPGEVRVEEIMEDEEREEERNEEEGQAEEESREEEGGTSMEEEKDRPVEEEEEELEEQDPLETRPEDLE